MNHPETRHQTTECFLCCYGIIYRGECFCGDRCREAYDAGFSRLDPNQARAFCALPLGSWVIVAGPPGMEIGAVYYAPFLVAAEAARRPRKVRNGPRSINSFPSKIALLNQDVASTLLAKLGRPRGPDNEPAPAPPRPAGIRDVQH
jgi:hypothetical protein